MGLGKKACARPWLTAHSPTTSSKPSPRDAEHVEIALPVSAGMDEVRSEAKAEFLDEEGDMLCGCGNVDLVQARLDDREFFAER
jgi:hypothetical protein